MRSADYTRLSSDLPPIYREDDESFAQVDAYLGLADELSSQLVATLEELPLTLGPDAALRWPAGVALDAGAAAVTRDLLARYDSIAEWVGFAFPTSWGQAAGGLAARRHFLGRSARLWRRRGTPRGLVDWFCEYFGITSEADRPFLLEHFKVLGTDFASEAYTATLFVPNSTQFKDYRRRIESAQFMRWYAPAHVDVRVCYVLPTMFATFGLFATPPLLPPNPTVTQLNQYQAEVVARADLLAEQLCNVVSVVDHPNGIHLYACGTEERPIDLLGVGLLPHTGT